MSRKTLVVFCALSFLISMGMMVEKAKAAPEAICVPWQANQALSHYTYSGAQIRVKGIARGDDAAEFRWDFGDGTGTDWATITNQYNLEASHVYSGPVGREFVATLYVRNALLEMDTDNYNIVIHQSNDLSIDSHLDVRVNMAIDEGLWYLHKTLVRGTWAEGSPGYGQLYGYWSDAYELAATGACVDAFQLNGNKVNGDYDGDPYVETVQRAINFILYHTYTFNIGPQTAGDPDTNGNGIGLVANNEASNRQTYIGGICMVALASSGAPNRVAEVGHPLSGGTDYVYGRTYADIVQDMVDFFAFGQVDAGAGRGGWRYFANYNDSDMSTTQWPPLAMLAAEVPQPAGMGATVPEFVREELINFVNYCNYTSCNNDHGGWGYNNPSLYINCTKAGVGIICHEFMGTPLDDVTVEGGLGFLYRHWNDTGGSWTYQRLLGNSYGMYAVMKAMRIPEPDIEIITNYDCVTGSQTDETFDWYYSTDSEPREGFAHFCVRTQHSDGSWDDVSGPNPVYDEFCTGWRILILSPGVVSRKPVAVICDCGDLEFNLSQDIPLNGSCSYHQDPQRNIVSYEWDFEYDGVFDPDATGMEAVIPGGYDVEGHYPVALRVTDDNPVIPETDIHVCDIWVHPPPHPPIAVIGGPYAGWPGFPVFFDASGSWDPSGIIISYDWDLDNDDLFGNEDNDTFGEPSDAVGVMPVWTWDSPYFGVIGLRVTDDDGAVDFDYTTVEIGNHPPVAVSGGPYVTTPNQTIVLDGSGSYDDDPGDAITCAWDLDNDGNFDDCDDCICEFTVGSEPGTVYDVCLKVTDSYGEYDVDCTTITVNPGMTVNMDIQPHACPNELDLSDRWSIQLAILGEEDFDVSTIDFSTVRLEGVAPFYISDHFEDSSRPVQNPMDCECTTEGRDGYPDKFIKFDTIAVLQAMGGAVSYQQYVLELTGELMDGTPIAAYDCLIFINPPFQGAFPESSGQTFMKNTKKDHPE